MIVDDHHESEYSFPPIPMEESHEALLMKTRILDPDQQCVLQHALTYCKGLVRSRKRQTIPPIAPKVIVHGGAGGGKSAVIKNMAQWMDKILRTAGDDQSKPYVLLTATTGTAASSINGITLHTAFNFNFGNEYLSLPDNLRDKKRDAFSSLCALIIDEGSLVSSDFLYKIDLRLKEIKERPKDDFGGVSIWIFLDILQLPPVMANYVFDNPKCNDYLIAHLIMSLWETFKVINLTYNHRQGKDKSYANMLNRMRIGEATTQDWDALRSRVRAIGHPDLSSQATFVTVTNKVVDDTNLERYNALPGTGVLLTAINLQQNNASFKPAVKNGKINQTQFRSEMYL